MPDFLINGPPKPKPIRLAIYTRLSVERLMDFSSCAAHFHPFRYHIFLLRMSFPKPGAVCVIFEDPTTWRDLLDKAATDELVEQVVEIWSDMFWIWKCDWLKQAIRRVGLDEADSSISIAISPEAAIPFLLMIQRIRTHQFMRRPDHATGRVFSYAVASKG